MRQIYSLVFFTKFIIYFYMIVVLSYLLLNNFLFLIVFLFFINFLFLIRWLLVRSSLIKWLRNNNKFDFFILHINIRSYCTNFDALITFSTCTYIVLSEKWLNSNSENLFEVPRFLNYSVKRGDSYRRWYSYLCWILLISLGQIIFLENLIHTRLFF